MPNVMMMLEPVPKIIVAQAFLGLSGLEIIIVAVVALLVIGPKDLPPLVRGVMALIRKLRLLVFEFQTQMSDLADEVDLKKQADTIKQQLWQETGLSDSVNQLEQSINDKVGNGKAAGKFHQPQQSASRRKRQTLFPKEQLKVMRTIGKTKSKNQLQHKKSKVKVKKPKA